MPHEAICDKLAAALKGIEKSQWAIWSNQLGGGVRLNHWQATASGDDRVALMRVSLLANPQGLVLGMKYCDRQVSGLRIPLSWIRSSQTSSVREYEFRGVRS